MQKQPELPGFVRDLEIEQSLNELMKLGRLTDEEGFPPETVPGAESAPTS